VTSNLSIAPSAAWIEKAAEQIRERGLTPLAARVIAQAASAGMSIEWRSNSAELHDSRGPSIHFLTVYWNSFGGRTQVYLSKKHLPGVKSFRNGQHFRKIAGREVRAWIDTLSGAQ
jgi:hypothetical protein